MGKMLLKLLTIGGLLGVALGHATADAARPNVLFIAVDDLNHWVGYLGRNPQTLTPNIDRLAMRGVWFTRSYYAAPVCNPSRAALMSGFRPGATGVYDNKEDFSPVIPESITLTTQFRNAGYYVCGAGKIYHSSVYRAGEWDDWFRGGKPREGEEDGSPTAEVRAGNLPITPLDCRDEDMLDSKRVVVGFLKSRAMEEVRTAYGCPWQNPFVEQFGGSLRREVLGHVIVLDQSHLERLLEEYIEEFYHIDRPHQGRDGQVPEPGLRRTQQPSNVIAIPVLGGLHHRFVPVAA